MKRYSLAHKRLVFKILNDFKGDVMKTSFYTEVPERTLRDWIYAARAAEILRKAAAQRQK
ncbi:MAG: hypothetical protein K8L97_19540 [Anaerolineae bacterium]|nr:hypothetical protein [Anaerolineae bacterium]